MCEFYYYVFVLIELYMFRAHVLIVRKSKLYYTASSIITLKQVSGLKLLNKLKLLKYEHIVVTFYVNFRV